MKKPHNKPTLEDLQAQRRTIEKQIYEINQAANREENRNLVGKCFRYRNSSGGPKWWQYTIVTHLDEEGYAQATIFEAMHGGRLQVVRDQYFQVLSGHREITRAQFNAAWEEFLGITRRAIHIF